MEVEPVGTVSSRRVETVDEDWGAVVSTISLDSDRFTPDAVCGLDTFSHVEVVYVFDRVDPDSVVTGARHPRGNPDWPEVGIFAQRAKRRPNRIGVCVCQLVDVRGLVLTVQGLDAVDGTPILDIKPYYGEYGPRGEVRQPDWSHEVMVRYWEPWAATP